MATKYLCWVGGPYLFLTALLLLGLKFAQPSTVVGISFLEDGHGSDLREEGWRRILEEIVAGDEAVEEAETFEELEKELEEVEEAAAEAEAEQEVVDETQVEEQTKPEEAPGAEGTGGGEEGEVGEELSVEEEAELEEELEEVEAAAAAAAAAEEEEEAEAEAAGGASVAAVEAALEALRADIAERWGEGEDIEAFFASVNFGVGEELEARQRERARRQFLRALAEVERGRQGDGVFTVTTMGTSVAASHDNFFKQSFTHVLGEWLAPVLAAAGVELRVWNHAMGANPVIPQMFCLGALGRQETDLYIYEFNMMLSSRDRGPNWQVENFLRSAFSHPRQPAVVAVKVDSSGKSVVNANPPKCKPYKLPLPGDKSIPEKYFGRNLEMMRRYSDAGYGIQFWSVDEARSCCQDCIKSERFTHSWSVKDKAFRGGDWHPGPHGHYLAGQVLAYSYGRLFLEAARAFEGLKASGADLDPGKLGPAAPAGPLPAPQTKPCADEPMCLQADTRCYTTFEPKGGQDLDLASFVAAPPTRFNETRPALPTPCGQPLHGRQACLDYHGLDRWIGGIWPLDEKAVLSKGVPAGYLDRKWCLLGREASGPLRLDLNAPRAGPGLRVCHASGDFGKYPNGLNAQVQTYQFRINGKDVPAQQVSEDTSLCAKIDISVEAGPFELEISAPSNQLIAISHVILP